MYSLVMDLYEYFPNKSKFLYKWLKSIENNYLYFILLDNIIIDNFCLLFYFNIFTFIDNLSNTVIVDMLLYFDKYF